MAIGVLDQVIDTGQRGIGRDRLRPHGQVLVDVVDIQHAVEGLRAGGGRQRQLRGRASVGRAVAVQGGAIVEGCGVRGRQAGGGARVAVEAGLGDVGRVRVAEVAGRPGLGWRADFARVGRVPVGEVARDG